MNQLFLGLLGMFLPLDTHIVECDLLETNYVYSSQDPDETPRFVQTVCWKYEKNFDNEYEWVDCGYSINKESDGRTGVYRSGDWFVCSFLQYGGRRMVILKSKEHLVTETVGDREAVFRHMGGKFRSAW